MKKLEQFIENLCGSFNNNGQIDRELAAGEVIHPKAKHINGVCNNKIKNLPKNFNGYFVIEESYYEQGKFTNILPHLFLFNLNEENEVVLTSYELPKGIGKEEFKNNNDNLIMDYNELEVSKKFTPMVYKENDGFFEGESVSNFTPETEFTLKEKIEDEKMYVSEVFRKNGKITFGFVDPIIYEKIK